MRALAGPAMLLVVIGGFTIYKAMSKEDAPSREFTELELAADDEEHTGTCYSLSTVLRSGSNGPEHQFQRFTFEKFGEQVRLVEVEASAELPTDIAENIDRMLMAPHHRRSTATDRCRGDGGIGYQYPPPKK